ncbi:MAG: glycosyltransferase family 39 protein [Patescibacteria group bacterium]
MTQKRFVTPLLLAGVMVLSLGLHVYLTNILNVVEDESAYMMDAWQINTSVLPFREFGATKGPVFLFLLKGWQLIAGQTMQASRLFTSLLHVVSIPLFYAFVVGITRKRLTALLAAALWGLVPAAVSLTTNVIHAPLELVWILAAAVLLVRRPERTSTYMWAALFFFLAVLTRATAVAFLPLMLLLILWRPQREGADASSHTDSGDLARGEERVTTAGLPGRMHGSSSDAHPVGVKLSAGPAVRLGVFCLTGALLLAVTIAIVYPLYGWPKTAFFFNADAVLIADDQQAAYQEAVPSGLTMLFRGLLPLWYEGLPLILMAIALLFLSIRAITMPLRIALAAVLLLVAFYSYQPLFQKLSDYWSQPNLVTFEQSARTTFTVLAALTGLALLLPAPKISMKYQVYALAIIIMWLAGFIGFYRFWGRDPTPFYILESIPAFCLAAALAITYIASRSRALGAVVAVIVAASFVAPYSAMALKQYRGTVAPQAAIAAGKAIEHHVPEGEAIFTAQPIYPFLGKRPLYKYLTHPGWYLAERAKILPTSIRRTFFPDMEDLTRNVEREVSWIVIDWRTNDVYFKKGVKQTEGLRQLLTTQFAPVAEIPNDVTEPIILYKRK